MTKPFFTRIDCDVGRPPNAISLDKANRLLSERGKFMSCQNNEKGLWRALEPSEKTAYPMDTHQALLVCIEPLEQDSAEKLLKDLYEWMRPNPKSCPERDELLERAKKLLGEE